MNKIMKEKCETYKAKGILGCRRGKTYAAAAKENERRSQIRTKRVRTQIEGR